jgi:GR25 family glycosyltransferase involved in LPS biosynthesis
MQLAELFPLVCYTNMDYRPDRNTYAWQEISKLGLIPVRIPGVVYTGTNSTVLNGQIGCGLAHLNGLKLAKERNQNVLMFEDDVKFINDYPHIIQDALNELPEQWDMLYLGGNICRSIFQVTPHLGKLTHAQSTHAYGVNRNFLDKILNSENRILQRPIDLIYAEELIPANNCYITIPMIAIQKTDFSNIENRKVDYSSWMEYRFYEQLIRK